MKGAVRLFLLVVLTAGLLQVAPAQMPPSLTPFSGDMHWKRTDGNSETAKIYVGHERMRIEMPETGGPRGGGAMITNYATKTSYFLMPEQHMYMEVKADQASMMARRGGAPNIKPLFDPNNPCAGAKDGTTCKDLGTAEVNGRTCEHWRITGTDGKSGEVWIDKSLHFPIKGITPDETYELTNINVGEPSASLFEIPPGYRKFDMSQMMQGMHPPQE